MLSTISSGLTWGRVENPRKVFKVGDTVKSFIKEISGTKIALSLKFEDANPWKDAEQKYSVGSEVTGKVARMTDFGANSIFKPLVIISHIQPPRIYFYSSDSSAEITASISTDTTSASSSVSLSSVSGQADYSTVGQQVW